MFTCQRCKKANLDIAQVIELGPDDYSDEVSLQILRCTCGAAVLGKYEESRRGSDARWHHDAWPATDAAIAEVAALIAACPTPRAHRCTCPSHVALADDGYRKFLSGESFRLTK